METEEKSQKQVDEDNQLEYLAEILTEAFLDHKVASDPLFTDPRINQPIYDLIMDSKEREKNKKLPSILR